MKKQLCLLLLFCLTMFSLMVQTNAQAGTILLGNTVFEYTVPQGFTELHSQKRSVDAQYISIFTEASQEEGSTFQTAIVPDRVYQVMEESGIEECVYLSTVDAISTLKMSPSLFEFFRSGVIAEIDQSGPDTFELVQNEPDAFSIYHVSNVEDGGIYTMITFTRVGQKVLTTSYVRDVDDKQALLAANTKFIQQLNFRLASPAIVADAVSAAGQGDSGQPHSQEMESPNFLEDLIGGGEDNQTYLFLGAVVVLWPILAFTGCVIVALVTVRRKRT